jgi:hypothetical protein
MGFFKPENLGGHTEHSVECPVCRRLEGMAAPPFRVDKWIAENNTWETAWEK